jgi:hypothetical protein
VLSSVIGLQAPRSIMEIEEETTKDISILYYIDENLRLERERKKKEVKVLLSRYLYILVYRLSLYNTSEYSGE